ncbi:MAG: deoxyribonuclease IV [Deltaproteobacteria bacterium]|nr:deoxyribonuclease IV [Deltaproteobacteria bacterium]
MEMRFGFHLSIAGGLSQALRRAQALGCQSLQIFVQNPRTWRWRPVPDLEIEKFIALRRQIGLAPLVVHLSYLPNLGASEAALYQRSRDRLQRELELAAQLKADFLVCHPGHALVPDGSLDRVAAALAAAVSRIPPPPLILIENTAGQGRELGWQIWQLNKIIEFSQVPVGLCLDTAHAFAAGYDLRQMAGINRLADEIAQGTGLTALKVVHLNDSRARLGSYCDRHWHLGQGEIGLAGLRQFLNHAAFTPQAIILETPTKHADDDPRNLAVARSLLRPPTLISPLGYPS